MSLGNVTLSQIAVCRIDRRTLAPRVYEGGGAQRRGEYAAECYEFASVFGELETIYRMGSPRPSGTPLINAGGKGALQRFDKSEFDCGTTLPSDPQRCQSHLQGS